ncbi:phage tail protein [Kribbia dieselivorans]|uniref:phage tail protein n=1 Tax=Kribbia dieselivorans TaxID=331526 RepID=UPI000839184B|nr:phage tail protein [Kribbia dieselivorans]
MAPLADPLDSAAANGFRFTLDGIEVPKVIEVTGLTQEVEKIEMKEQTKDGKYITRTLIGRPKGGEITVTRGLTDSKTISDWLKSVMTGDVKTSRKTAAVEITDYQGTTLKTYNFVNVWVSKVEISNLKAGSTESATEKFTMSFDESTVA